MTVKTSRAVRARSRRKFGAALFAAAAVWCLAGCDHTHVQRAGAEATVPAADTNAPSVTPTVSMASRSESTSTTSNATASAVDQRCAASELAVTRGGSNGAGGSNYLILIVRNRGRVACTLDGWPTVSFVDAAGRQLGGFGVRDSGPENSGPATVRLAPGGFASALLSAVNPSGGPVAGSCRPAVAAAIEFAPPGQQASVFVKNPQEVCTTAQYPPGITPLMPGTRAGFG